MEVEDFGGATPTRNLAVGGFQNPLDVVAFGVGEAPETRRGGAVSDGRVVASGAILEVRETRRLEGISCTL